MVLQARAGPVHQCACACLDRSGGHTPGRSPGRCAGLPAGEGEGHVRRPDHGCDARGARAHTHRRLRRLCPLGQRQPSAAGEHRPRQDRRTGGDGRWELVDLRGPARELLRRWGVGRSSSDPRMAERQRHRDAVSGGTRRPAPAGNVHRGLLLVGQRELRGRDQRPDRLRPRQPDHDGRREGHRQRRREPELHAHLRRHIRPLAVAGRRYRCPHWPVPST